MTYKTYPQLLEDARSHIREIAAKDAIVRHRDGGTVFLDVREPQEANLGMVPGAMFIPRGNLESNVEARIPRDARIVVYCAHGNRSALSAETLERMGYENVESLAGGFVAWVGEGGDVE